MMTDTQAAWAVITGASRGIGRAAAERFLAAGWRVANLSRTPCDLADVTDIRADLAAPDWGEAAARALAAAVEGAGRLCLIHNCAFNVPAPIGAIEAADLRQVLEVGLVAPTQLNRILLPAMKPGSSILYVGSTLSLRATRAMAAYVALKHGLLGLMRATAQDLAGTGLHTCLVCPGFTETEMLKAYGGEALAHLASLSTQNRLIAPAEIAEALYFAALNPVVNGSALSCDLGFVEP
ncbi:MAG: SDR family NAD(P)-dependent oxidoreductase [Caulobacteraceae bacterium]|nr:SDR family NAD(P)-dependent oxidoreductase [Caulobacteraceae bacterium]